jgi:hypothetical protein
MSSNTLSSIPFVFFLSLLSQWVPQMSVTPFPKPGVYKGANLIDEADTQRESELLNE